MKLKELFTDPFYEWNIEVLDENEEEIFSTYSVEPYEDTLNLYKNCDVKECYPSSAPVTSAMVVKISRR